MKITVLQKNLIKGLNVVSKAVNPRSPLPILGNILLKTDNGRLKLSASDLHITISCWIGASVEENGEITVPARIFHEFIGQVLDEKINFELDGLKLNVTTDRFSASFNGAITSEFPDFEKFDKKYSFEIPFGELSKAISKVIFSVASDESRPVLTGVYFDIDSDTLKLVGIDGFRMTEYTVKLKTPMAENVNFIVPAKALNDIVKSLPTDIESIKFGVNDQKSFVSLSCEDMESQIRLITGDYPDYKAIIPGSFHISTVISKNELVNAIKLVSVFAKDLGYAIKLKLTSGLLEIESKPNELGSNHVKLSCEKEGEDLSISFNGRYLLDFLGNLEGDSVSMKFVENKKPGLFQNPTDDMYWYLVMPIDSDW